MIEKLKSIIETLESREEKIILRFQETIPFDIFALCKDIGVDVVESRKDLPKDMSGVIIKEGGKYHIYSNGNESDTRQRFTIAHELAHYLLHKGDMNDEYPENFMLRGGMSNENELEANQLAAQILMPSSKINEYIEERNSFSIGAMAEYFDVSNEAMSGRMGIPMDI